MSDQDIEQDQMTVEEDAAIQSLRDRGFVVVIWNPTEIGNSHGDALEEIVIERGNVFLASDRPATDEEQD